MSEPIQPAKRNIMVSNGVLEDPEIKPIFANPWGVQLYLSIGTSHLRSQHFNKAIRNVLDGLCASAALLPNTAEEMSNLLIKYGMSEPAVSYPWIYRAEVLYENEYYKDEYDARRNSNAEKKLLRDFRLMELVNALHGIDPWIIIPAPITEP
ncbi:MAG: hypothetical protein WCI45_12540 [Desulfuromonadales bacterium]